jgi:hypothetical protein
MMESNATDKGQQTTVDERLKGWAYPSLAKSGTVEIELPSLPGSPRPTEMLHVKDFGRHVAGAVERSLKGNPYPKSGPKQSPAEVLGHYVGTARGARLLDKASLARLERLSKEFAGEQGEDRQKYFETMIRPYLISLTPSGNRAVSKTTGTPFPSSKMPPART